MTAGRVLQLMGHIDSIRVYIYKYNKDTDTDNHTEINGSKNCLLIMLEFIYHIFQSTILFLHALTSISSS